MKYIYGDVQEDFVSLPAMQKIRCIGVSDGALVESLLAQKFSYTNTFYHQEPFLDICSIESASKYQDYDFVLCSDVMEHTQMTPVEVLPILKQMIRVGGFLFLTVPSNHMATTIEWYAGAAEPPRPEKLPTGEWVVHWKTRRGTEYVDTHPSFHGGPGDTLEMRMISHEQIVSEGRRTGFAVHTLDYDSGRGYYWPALQDHEGFARMDGRLIVMQREA